MSNKLYSHPIPLTVAQRDFLRRITTFLKDIPCCTIESSVGHNGRFYVSVAVGVDAVHAPGFDDDPELQSRCGVYLFWMGPRGGIESNRWGFLLDDAMGLKAEEYFHACLNDIAETANELYERLKEIAQ